MATKTANGFPYPVGTDRVMDGDDAIRALAEYTDAKTMCWGHATKGGNQALGTNATAWFSDLTPVQVCGGVTADASGIVVPIRGYYLVWALAHFTAANGGHGQTILGDGAGVMYAQATLTVGTIGTGVGLTPYASGVALLNAGTRVRWGATAGAGGATFFASPAGVIVGFHVRLILPMP